VLVFTESTDLQWPPQVLAKFVTLFFAGCLAKRLLLPLKLVDADRFVATVAAFLDKTS
jgi:hypothetical protein